MQLPPTVEKYFPNAEPISPVGTRADALEIDQIAVVVEDIDKAIDYLAQTYGWGPFYKAEHNGEAWYRGEIKNSHFYMAFCLVGSLEIELLQYVSGDCVHKEAEPGLFHLRLLTDDMKYDLQINEADGAKVIWGAQNAGEFVGAYIEPNLLRFRVEFISSDFRK